ncbi:MAG: PEP-CTERM/exosortase system-associated acyltransferase [Gammaproteobacteria bacterium]|nr:PEP-CTERM/exosortase system-associated acyltransferase [Gammaproteobacteria bacterium]
MNIEEHFNQYFRVQQCRSEQEIRQCQRIRYLSYCVDHHFIDMDQFPDELERDQYDSHSAHSAIVHQASGEYIATVRLVLWHGKLGQLSFPVEKLEILRRMKRDKKWRSVPQKKIGEISRFSICKNFRRRVEDYENLHGISDTTFRLPTSDRRCAADITLGLFKAIVCDSYDHELTHWYAIMEPSLIRLLGRFGIQFCEVGAPVDYSGIRQPCIAYIPAVLRGIHQNNLELWEFITNNGEIYGTEYLFEQEPEEYF